MSLFIPDGPSNPSGITDCENASAASECSPDKKPARELTWPAQGSGITLNLRRSCRRTTTRF
jgi:hypothetical protein